MDNLIVGCGLTGSVIARHLAEKGEQVTIWERRNHIGGNMYDYVDDNNICVHKYGPHVFHTYNEVLKNFMCKYSEWIPFNITCRVNMVGKVTPSPFNYQTIDDYYSKEDALALKEAIEYYYPEKNKATIVDLLNCDNERIRGYAEFLFKHDYSLYTAKQWGLEPSEIDTSVLKRVPVLFSYKDGYFDDTWQMMPKDGYTSWFKNILDHKNITVKLNIDAKNKISISDNKIYLNGRQYEGRLIYTGAIDELLDMIYGPLPYRSLKFKWKTEYVERYQEAALVAYPEAEDYTRITEYSHFPQKNSNKKTSLAYEYPVQYIKGEVREPYYPILTEESQELYAKYKALADEIDNLFLCGRLADFRYYNMDQALERALEICKSI